MRFLSDILSRKAALVGIDQDPEAVAATKKRLKLAPQKVDVINSPFIRFSAVLEDLGLKEVDGILLDLGLSSHQIDSPERGFSFMFDGPLDMRMDPDCKLTAEDVINNYPKEKLASIFKKYGEEKRGSRAAAVVCEQRKKRKIKTTSMLREVLEPVLSGRYLNASLARIFQAIRIEVNGELSQLREVLPVTLRYLATGGRLVVISYHSLEDRIVKRFMVENVRGCTCPKEFPVCVCGRKPLVRLIRRKVVRPSSEEIRENRRARSARLRVAEKIAD